MAWEKTNISNMDRKSSGVYYARAKIGGKLYRKSLGTKVFSLAVKKLPSMLNRIRSASRDVVVDSLGESINEWWRMKLVCSELTDSTVEYYEGMMEWVAKRLDVTKKLSDSNATKFWVEEVKHVVSANYANNILSMMRGAADIEMKAGKRTNNPFSEIRKLQVSDPDINLPTKRKFRKVVEHIRSGPHFTAEESADMVEWLAYSGLRRGELNALVWKDVGEKNIIVRGKVNEGASRAGTKNGKIRRVPINEALRELIDKRRSVGVYDDQLVFSIKDPKKSLGKACKAVGCVHMSCHSLRHMFATVCIEAGVDIPTVSRWLGHQDGGVLAMKVYGHLRDQHSQEQMRGVEF